MQDKAIDLFGSIKAGMIPQFRAAQVHQQALVLVQHCLAVLAVDAQFLLHLLVEILQQKLPCSEHRFVDLAGKLALEVFEAAADFFGFATILVDGGDPPLEIHTGANGSQHFVTGAEYAFEQLELLRQQLIDTGIRLVAAVHEVDHHHIVLLPVTVAATDALFDTLWIPRQVVIDDQRAELEVDAFRACLRGDHDGAALLEVLNQRGAGVSGFGASNAIAAFMPLQPVFVNGLRPGIGVGAVEQHDAVGCFSQQGKQVILGALGLGENDGLLARS